MSFYELSLEKTIDTLEESLCDWWSTHIHEVVRLETKLLVSPGHATFLAVCIMPKNNEKCLQIQKPYRDRTLTVNVAMYTGCPTYFNLYY